MSNTDILDQLRHRRSSVEKLIAKHNQANFVEVLRAELLYVNSMIEYRERNGSAPSLE